MKAQVNWLEREVDWLMRRVAPGREYPGTRVVKDDDWITDDRWSCTKCNSLLGWYDREGDVLRMRHRGYLFYVRPGGASPRALLEAVDKVLQTVGVEVEEGVFELLVEMVTEAVTPGFIHMICFECSQFNVVDYSTPEEAAESRAADLDG